MTLTGATGHLSQSILRQIRSGKGTVRAVIRPGSNAALLEGFCDDVRTAGLDDVDALADAFEGSEVVIHTAAAIDIRRGRIDAMRRVNVTGSANIIEASRRAGVRRLVYISSIEAMDLRNPVRPIDEAHGFSRGSSVMDYGQTKAEASWLVAEAGFGTCSGGHGRGLETVLICPTAIIGPWDFRGGLLTTMIRRYLAGRIPASIPGNFDYVDVRDVAGAVLAATGQGRPGETYITSGTQVEVRELFSTIGKAAGIRRFTPSLPLPIARAGGEVSELWSRVSGREALFTRGSIEILQVNAHIDSSKAERELGYRSRPFEETIRDTVAWIQGTGEIDPSPKR